MRWVKAYTMQHEMRQINKRWANSASELTLGTRVPSAIRSSSTFHLRKLRTETDMDDDKKKITPTVTLSVLTLKTLNNLLQSFHLTLTFVKACRHIASRRAQQNPEDHRTGHESPSVGRWQETQAGQDYSGQIINAVIQTCSIPTHCSFNTLFYATPVCGLITSYRKT